MLRIRLLCQIVLIFALMLPAGASAIKGIRCPAQSKNEDENKKIARKYFEMGNVYYRAKKYKLSIDSYECVLSFVPYSLMSRYHLARSYDAIGLYEKARENYSLILSSNTDEAKSLRSEVSKRFFIILDLVDKPREYTAAEEEEEEPEEVVDDTEKPGLTSSDITDASSTQKLQLLEKEFQDFKKFVRSEIGRKERRDYWYFISGDGLRGQPWFWGGIGVTGVLTVSTVLLGLKALNLNRQLEKEWSVSTRNKAEDFEMYTDISLGAAVLSAALVVAASIGYKYPPSNKKKNTNATQSLLLPACDGAGCMLTLTISF